MPPPVLVHLTTVGSAFEGRVLAARLGADGILALLRGADEGPYPIPGPVEVVVDLAQLEEARALLAVQAIDQGYVPARDQE